MIIQRYILRLVAVPFLFVSGLITILLLAEVFGEVVTRALSGTLPGWAVVQIIAYQIPAVLEELMPGAFFLAAVLALGQLSASSERVVLQAVGYSDNRILGLVLSVAVLVMGFLFFLTLVLVPWSARQVADLERTLAERPAAELVQPGEFTEINREGAVLYARASDGASGELLNVFLAYFDDGDQQLVTADRAQVVQRSGVRYLQFCTGELLSDTDDDSLEKSLFDVLEIRLDVPEVSTSPGRSEQSLMSLWESSSMRDKTEAQQRLMFPLTVIVFAFWAVSLTRYSPRSGKNAAVLPAVILYVLYMYFMRTVNASVRSEGLSLWANYWWLHLVAIALAMMVRLNWRTWLRNGWMRLRPAGASAGDGGAS